MTISRRSVLKLIGGTAVSCLLPKITLASPNPEQCPIHHSHVSDSHIPRSSRMEMWLANKRQDTPRKFHAWFFEWADSFWTDFAATWFASNYEARKVIEVHVENGDLRKATNAMAESLTLPHAWFPAIFLKRFLVSGVSKDNAFLHDAANLAAFNAQSLLFSQFKTRLVAQWTEKALAYMEEHNLTDPRLIPWSIRHQMLLEICQKTLPEFFKLANPQQKQHIPLEKIQLLIALQIGVYALATEGKFSFAQFPASMKRESAVALIRRTLTEANIERIFQANAVTWPLFFGSRASIMVGLKRFGLKPEQWADSPVGGNNAHDFVNNMIGIFTRIFLKTPLQKRLESTDFKWPQWLKSYAKWIVGPH